MKSCFLFFIIANVFLFILFDLRTFVPSPDIVKTHQIIKNLPNSSKILATSNYVPQLNNHELTLLKSKVPIKKFDYILIANQQPLDYEILQSPISYLLNAIKKRQYAHYFIRWLYGEREYTKLTPNNYKNIIISIKNNPNYTLVNNNQDSLLFKQTP